MILHRALGMLFLASLLSACAAPQRLDPTVLHLTVHSDPPGAQIFFWKDGKYIHAGISPQAIAHQTSLTSRTAGRIFLPGVSARWPSGATQTVSSLEASFANGMTQKFTLVRPTQAAGLDIDLQAARRAATEARAENNQGAAALYWGNAFLEGYNRGRQEDSWRRDEPTYRPSASPAPAPSYTCSTRRSGMFGDQLRTDCRPQ